MKSFVLAFTILVLTNPLFAETGHDKISKLYEAAQPLDLKSVKDLDLGIYTGRCFTYDSNYPYGSFIAFKNYSLDSGPVEVDPEVHVMWHTSNQSRYFEENSIDQVIAGRLLHKLKPTIRKGENAYEYNYPFNWVIQYRQDSQYILQKNIENGITHSYCYYFNFRQR